MVNAPSPVSLSRLIDALLAPVGFHGDITTPAGTALGGSVDLIVFSTGMYFFNVDMHDSGLEPYDFRVRCALQSPSGLTVLFQTSGHTDGWGSDLLGDLKRDFHAHQTGHQDLIRLYWMDVRASSMAVNKSYEDAGLLHTIEDIAKDLLGFLVADVTFGAGLALVIAASAELTNALDGSFVGHGGLVGVLVAGGVVWVFGPSAILAAVAAGVVAGAITDAAIKHRLIREDEYRFAATVFADTLPPREHLYLTNLSYGDGRKFTWPNLERSVLVNLGEAFDEPMSYVDPRHNYNTKGQVFIHELTHAWQIRTMSFIPGVVCNWLTQTNAYDFGPARPPWSEFGPEQQAAIVDQWFGAHAGMWNSIDDVVRNLALPAATQDSKFTYIANNIRLGQT
jgi:hypothetical protein